MRVYDTLCLLRLPHSLLCFSCPFSLSISVSLCFRFTFHLFSFYLINRLFLPFCSLLFGSLPNSKNPFLVMKQIYFVQSFWCIVLLPLHFTITYCGICIVISFCICIASIRNVNIKRFIISKSLLSYFFSWLSFSGKITVCFSFNGVQLIKNCTKLHLLIFLSDMNFEWYELKVKAIPFWTIDLMQRSRVWNAICKWRWFIRIS